MIKSLVKFTFSKLLKSVFVVILKCTIIPANSTVSAMYFRIDLSVYLFKFLKPNLSFSNLKKSSVHPQWNFISFLLSSESNNSFTNSAYCFLIFLDWILHKIGVMESLKCFQASICWNFFLLGLMELYGIFVKQFYSCYRSNNLCSLKFCLLFVLSAFFAILVKFFNVVNLINFIFFLQVIVLIFVFFMFLHRILEI